MHHIEKWKSIQAIRESIDSYPGGLSLSTKRGLPILVNVCMQRLIYDLTGHTLLEVEATWEELKQGKLRSGCTLCADLQEQEAQDGEEETEELTFSFADRSIWRFEKRVLTNMDPGTVQITAMDVTELCNFQKKLRENNREMQELQERQWKLQKNIEQINQEKEVLAAKMRIHNDLGKCILITRKALDEQLPAEEFQEIRKNWTETIGNLRDAERMPAAGERSPETELVEVSRMIGCTISFRGSRPTEHSAARLFYSAVRETLNNAVRHSGATELFVETQNSGGYYSVQIWDNGSTNPGPVTEGVGLGCLRQKLEREGGTMDIRSENGVRLLLEIPRGGKRK